MDETTDSIRALAQRWSLSGDEKLLKLLQTTHQKIVSNCREVNTRLDEMEAALGETTINLQNVNNKFMALSNSQFVESRVYDDDADITTDTKPIEEFKPETTDSLTLLKQGLVVLDNAHETAEIWDDSDVDSDTEISVVLKPKDPYAHRPLPYIIGSYAWKNKWHSGLVIEDSDSDSDMSKHDVREVEQYSESDEDVRTDKLMPDTTISDSGSSFHSERDKELRSVPVKKQTPADIAAELAARLGNAAPRVLEETEEIIPQTTPKPVYRPQKPISSTIFSDEPPPMERDTYEYSSESQEEDIFAEINKKQPYNQSNTAQNTLDDDFFGRKVLDEDVSNFKSKAEQRNAKQKSTLFEDESEPELFVAKSKATTDTQTIRSEDNTTKKPVGGISLFGSNKGTESIGAAILKRNIRKSSSSDNESEKINNRNTIKNNPVSDSEEDNTTSDNTTNANYIFDNLFAKAKQAEQKSMKHAIVDRSFVEEKPKVPKAAKTKDLKDLFSDNIFDDIDDIFTSNIKIPTKEANKNVKSIFDDDDDLFSDIAKKPTEITKPKDNIPNSSKKSIFDSDDDLFGDVKDTKTFKTDETIDKQKPEKSIDTQNRKETNNNTDKPDIVKDTTIAVDVTKHIQSKDSMLKPKAKSKSIFDSDSDDDLFSDNIKNNKPNQVLDTSKSLDSETKTELFKDKKKTQHVTLKAEPAKVIQSPSLFDEEEIDDLFINANKATHAKASGDTIIEHLITKDIQDVVNKYEDMKEKTLKEEDTSKLNDNKSTKVLEDKNLPIVDVAVSPTIATPEHEPHKLKDNLFTNVETENMNSNIPENIVNDDIIEASQENSNIQSKSKLITNVAIESNLPVSETDNDTKNINTEYDSLLPDAQEPFIGNSKKEYPQDSEVTDSIFDEVPVKQKQEVIPEQNSLVPLSAAFDDIFKEPPAFDKTKETKKTVNVNALFEDDSDDEALFFKKNDVISDEKPELFTPSANFGLFNDEPPAFLDFAPKTSRSNQFEGDDDDLFSSIPKKQDETLRNEPPDVNERNLEDQIIKQSENTTQKQYPNEEKYLNNSSTEITKLDTSVKTTNEESKEVPDSDEELFSNIPKVPEISQKEQTPKLVDKNPDQFENKPKDTKTDAEKKFGKLNAKDFNINVQALVPGASPKKILKEPSNDTTDTNKVAAIDIKESQTMEEVSKTEVDNAEPEAVKSISFVSEPKSGVLDNKLSKQRPRIQVKRRPSSRKARHEAVRKSVIDIDDETDNSSSFDEPLPKIMSQDTKYKENELNQDIITKTSIMEAISNENRKPDIVEIPRKNTDVQKDFDDVDRMFKTDDIDKRGTLNIHNEITKDESSLDEGDSKGITKIETNHSKVVTNTQNEESTSTTKVVYILNDEDIFTNKPEKHKDTEISKTIQADEVNQESSKSVQPKKKTKTMFDLSDDDDDLFGKSSKSKKVEVKSKLFESDSEEDIFSSKKKNKEVKRHIEVKDNVKGKAKGSLFGDDDGDDLFGVKTKSSTQSTKASTSRPRETAKSTNIVFDDPLSMLEDD